MSDETDELIADYRELGERMEALDFERRKLVKATEGFVTNRTKCERILHDLKTRLNRAEKL